MPQTPDLTVKERELVESKLDRRMHESHGDAFERLVQGKDAEETQVNIESLINFVDLLGSTDAWDQLSIITRVEFQGLNPKTKQMQSSVIAFKVSDKQIFFKTLRVMGYHVNTLTEKARIRMGIVRINFKAFIRALAKRGGPLVKRLPSHPYDNARQRTRSIRDPQLHIYNEQGDDNFQAHWDIGSSNTGVPVVDPIGGFWHGYFASPEEVARHLSRIE
jgi:hypothetical protein